MYMGGQQQRTCTRNTLNFRIPGFAPPLQVRFPEGRLPVCVKCKKNYKTRDMCRNQSEHTDLPWTSVYICVTLDESCIGPDGKLKKGTFSTRSIESSPYCYQQDVSANTLICGACKTKNYTRKQCRSKNRHRNLPWSTVYVILTHKSDETKIADLDKDSILQTGKRSRSEDNAENAAKRRQVGESKHSVSVDENGESVKVASLLEKLEDESDDIDEIDKSRTFLVEVNKEMCIIKWLDRDKTHTAPKAMPMNFFGMPAPVIPNAQITGHYWNQANMENVVRDRNYQFMGDQSFPVDGQYPLQFVPFTAAQYPYWQKQNTGAAVNRLRPNSTLTMDYPNQYYPDYYGQTLQMQQGQLMYNNTDSVGLAPATPAEGGHMALHKIPAQQPHTNQATRPFDAYTDNSNEPYNVPQFYQYRV